VTTAIGQGDYNLTLAAVATANDTLVFAGTVDLYRGALSGGCATLRNTTNALNGCSAPAKVAPAQHALAALATSGQPLLFVGNDSGPWRSTDGVNQQATRCSADDAAHFDNINGGLGSLAEVVSVAQHPSHAAGGPVYAVDAGPCLRAPPGMTVRDDVKRRGRRWPPRPRPTGSYSRRASR
jgi:hypothetical protein